MREKSLPFLPDGGVSVFVGAAGAAGAVAVGEATGGCCMREKSLPLLTEAVETVGPVVAGAEEGLLDAMMSEVGVGC